MTTKNRQAIIVSLLFFAASCFGLHHHELWLDEAHHYLLGSKSASLNELIHNSRYEGHPLLWNVIMYVLSHLFHNALSIQLFTITASTACVFLIVRYSPFLLPFNIALCLSYFMIYEYSIIARPYSLSLLLCLIIIINLSSQKKNFVLIALLIFLLSNVHLFSAFVGLGLYISHRAEWKQENTSIKLISGLIITTGFITCVLQAIPPVNHYMHGYNHDDLLSLKRLSRSAWVPLKGLLPLPDIGIINYWNSNLFINTNKTIAIILSVIVFLFPAFLFKHNKKALLLFYIPSIAILIFFYFTPLMLTSRNCGYMSVLLLLVYWINRQPVSAAQRSYGCIVLCIQVVAGIMVYVMDLRLDFSNSKKAGEFITTNFKTNDSTKILLSHHGAGPALVSYTTKSIYYLEENAYGNYCKWHIYPFINDNSNLFFKISHEFRHSKNLIVIFNEKDKMQQLMTYAEKLHLNTDFKPTLIKAFDSAVVSSENYFVYKLE